MTDEERTTLVHEYLRYLEYVRTPAEMPRSRTEGERVLADLTERVRTNPYYDAWETLEELVSDDPETAWDISLEIIASCHELDLGTIGAGPLETLLHHHHARFADRFEKQILSGGRFRKAFSFVRTGGVPLTVQRRLNEAQGR